MLDPEALVDEAGCGFTSVDLQGVVVIVSVIAYGLSTVVFGASNLFWLAVFGLAGTGAADTVSMVMRQTIRQLSTPNNLRGRPWRWTTSSTPKEKHCSAG